MATAAATDSTMVMEIGYSNLHYRQGYSLVIDFNEKDGTTAELYKRKGVTTSSGFDIAYSVGMVQDYNGEGDYGGEFVSVSGSVKGFGVDYCQSPKENMGKGARAVTASFSIGLGNSVSFSYDYYEPIAFWK